MEEEKIKSIASLMLSETGFIKKEYSIPGIINKFDFAYGSIVVFLQDRKHYIMYVQADGVNGGGHLYYILYEISDSINTDTIIFPEKYSRSNSFHEFTICGETIFMMKNLMKRYWGHMPDRIMSANFLKFVGGAKGRGLKQEIKSIDEKEYSTNDDKESGIRKSSFYNL